MNYQKFQIAELCSNGVGNLNDEEIAELILLEEEEAMSTCISPMLQHYLRYFCKRLTSSDPKKGWLIIRGQIYGNEISCQTLIRMSPEAFTWLLEYCIDLRVRSFQTHQSWWECCNISNHLCTKRYSTWYCTNIWTFVRDYFTNVSWCSSSNGANGCRICAATDSPRTYSYLQPFWEGCKIWNLFHGFVGAQCSWWNASTSYGPTWSRNSLIYK